jgi:hypothetical protein
LPLPTAVLRKKYETEREKIKRREGKKRREIETKIKNGAKQKEEKESVIRLQLPKRRLCAGHLRQWIISLMIPAVVTNFYRKLYLRATIRLQNVILRGA